MGSGAQVPPLPIQTPNPGPTLRSPTMHYVLRSPPPPTVHHVLLGLHPHTALTPLLFPALPPPAAGRAPHGPVGWQVRAGVSCKQPQHTHTYTGRQESAITLAAHMGE